MPERRHKSSQRNTAPIESTVPEIRVRTANRAPVARERAWVLYWMTAFRRTRSNFALDRATDWAHALGKPLLVLEPLRVGYPWASDRLHAFILDGMRDNEEAFARTDAFYFPYVEPREGAGKGLLDALAAHACVVIADDFPCFFLPKMVAAAARRVDVRFEAVDSNGLLPLHAADHAYAAAHQFRRFARRELPKHLQAFPRPSPLSRARLSRIDGLPKEIEKRWPRASRALLEGSPETLAELPIDHSVPRVEMRGGSSAAHAALRKFVSRHLRHYATERRHPDANATSRLSPYLHFGHLSVHEIVRAVMSHEDGSLEDLMTKPPPPTKERWWGVGESAESYLDELVTWRELSYNFCAHRPKDYGRYSSLPAWARATLEKHAKDPRPHRYTAAQLERASTHDEVWNAAQTQLLREGWFHNAMRMLWGKKILEWSSSPRRALAAMEHIMNRWSLDGRDPNSYSGAAWTLGRYDRPWPERPIYGKVRTMSSVQAKRKLHLTKYLETYATSTLTPPEVSKQARSPRRPPTRPRAQP